MTDGGFDLETLCHFGAHLPRVLPLPPRAEYGALGPAVEAAVADALADAPQPVALALSGGVDSTVVAAVARRLGVRVRAFVLDTGRAAEEARAVAAALGLELTVVALPDRGMRAIEPAGVAAALGQPTHSAAPFGFLLLYRAIAAAGCATVLTGDGADEAFAGHAYHRAPPDRWATDVWSTWAAVRDLGIDAAALVRPGFRPSTSWVECAVAQAVADEVRALPESARRLQWLDLRLRQGPQCVALQRALCDAAGLAYRAPLADARVTAQALGAPLDPARPKQPLVELAERALGRPWQRVKQPMHALTGLRPLDDAWLRALDPAAVERHGVFEPAAVARAVAAFDGTLPWLPRALVIVATTHAGLDAGAFTPAQFRGASSSK